MSRSILLFGLTALGLSLLWGLDHALAEEDPVTAPPDTAPPPALAPVESAAAPETAPTTFAEPPEPTAEAEAPTLTAESPEPVPTEPAPAEVAEMPVVETMTEDPAREERVENMVAARSGKWVPAYQLTRPSWGVAMIGSVKAFGGNEVSTGQAGALARAIELQGEYQFPFLQSIGVLSAGPSAVLYPFTPTGTATASLISVWSIGGQVRYQARFFREQILVPMVGFEGQRLAYNFSNGNKGAAVLTGPVFGAMLLLNVFEPSSASEFYIDQGVSRSYLVGEYKNLQGTDGAITVSGASIFFGLRFEF